MGAILKQQKSNSVEKQQQQQKEQIKCIHEGMGTNTEDGKNWRR